LSREGGNQTNIGKPCYSYGVDDGAFPFAMWVEMTQGATVIFDHFAKFGLEMHLGYERERDGKIQPSKTKCVLVPPPKYFDTMEATAKLENGTETHTITTKPTNNQRRVKRQRCQGACYDRIDETQLIHKADS
jgi:hypothetical protein